MPRKKKRYKVIGGSVVEGHAPGETFEGRLIHEAYLIQIGAIKVLKD